MIAAFKIMKHVTIFLVIVVISFLAMNQISLSADKRRAKENIEEVNKFSIEKLGLSLEEVYYLYYFYKLPFQSSSIINKHLSSSAVKKLISDGYLKIIKSSNHGFDLSENEMIHEVTLTRKAKLIVVGGFP